MATAIQGEGVSQSALCAELRTYLENDNRPEHAEICAIIKKVEEIKACILGMANGGVISAQGSFPLEKVQEAQKCVQELQQELQKVYAIHVSVAESWAALKIDQKIPKEEINSAIITVLKEYQQRWSNMG